MAHTCSSADNVGPTLSQYAPFSVVLYLEDFGGRSDSNRFRAMPWDGKQRTVYDAKNQVRRDTCVGAWIRR